VNNPPAEAVQGDQGNPAREPQHVRDADAIGNRAPREDRVVDDDFGNR
jgi:hypothetical protein